MQTRDQVLKKIADLARKVLAQEQKLVVKYPGINSGACN